MVEVHNIYDNLTINKCQNLSGRKEIIITMLKPLVVI